MQDRQATPSDDAQQRMQLSALHQDQPSYGANPQALPPASPNVFNPSIENLYILRDANEVRGFLEENPFLIPLLQEAHIHIKKLFPNSDVVLEVVTDPEIAGEKDLVAFIVVGENVEDASEMLDRLDEEWWLDALDRAQGQFHITLEFK
jgi:hypothetical protein